MKKSLILLLSVFVVLGLNSKSKPVVIDLEKNRGYFLIFNNQMSEDLQIRIKLNYNKKTNNGTFFETEKNSIKLKLKKNAVSYFVPKLKKNRDYVGCDVSVTGGTGASVTNKFGIACIEITKADKVIDSQMNIEQFDWSGNVIPSNNLLMMN